MDYYRIAQDERCQPSPYIKDMADITSPKQMSKQNFSNLKPHNGVFVTPSKHNVYCDIIDRQIFLVSKTVKTVFDLYARDILYTHYCLMDNPNKAYHFYYHALFDEIDCLHPDSVHNVGKSKFDRIVLNRDQIKNRHVFRLANVRTKVIIISLQAAESLLRRDVMGIQFTPIELR